MVASFAYLAVDYRQLLSDESIRLMAKFVAEFFPPDVAPAFLAKAAWGALQTFAVATIGTLLAVGFGAAIALPAAGRFGLAPRLAARLLLNFLRSVPELVWAALMVIAAGLGPFAGTLALALHTTGVLGRLYAESLENVPPAPERALREGGSGRIAAFAYATLPLVTAQGVAYALYRLEMNIRMAAVRPCSSCSSGDLRALRCGIRLRSGPVAHDKTRRITALIASATMTRARKVSRIVLASPPLSIFIDWSISWPSPPAPTKPITTDARTAHSQR